MKRKNKVFNHSKYFLALKKYWTLRFFSTFERSFSKKKKNTELTNVKITECVYTNSSYTMMAMICSHYIYLKCGESSDYFGGTWSKGFATLKKVSKLPFFDKIGQAKSVGFRFYLVIWRSESRITSRYLEITSISLIYSLTYSRKKELLFWLSRGLNRLTCVTRQIRGDSQLRD